MLKKKNPSRNIIIVSFFTALSRIFGLIRDMMFSRVIGISFVADAFFIALIMACKLVPLPDTKTTKERFFIKYYKKVIFK